MEKFRICPGSCYGFRIFPLKPFLIFLLPLLFLVVPFAAHRADSHSGARFYRGRVMISTEWEGIIRVTGRVTVEKGVVLTVAPGTRVLLNGGEEVSIHVEGAFYVRGLPGMEVTFEPADGCDGVHFWGGILFSPGSRGEIGDAVIRCSKKGVGGDLTGVTIERVSAESPRTP